MALKFLLMLLASQCVSKADVTSLIAPNYAKVFRTGSFASTKTDTKNSDEGYDDGRLQNSEVTTDASDIYNVYYPVMEAQTVVDNGNQTVLQALPAENSIKTNFESPVKVLRLNPLASFINAFFRQPVYVPEDSEDKTESSLTQQSAADEPSSQPNTTKFPSTLDQPTYSYKPNSYNIESPSLYDSGLTAESPRLSGSGLTAGSPRLSGSGLTAESPRLYDSGLIAGSPRLSGSSLTAESPRLYGSGLAAGSPRLSGSGLTAESPRLYDSGLTAGFPRLSGSDLTAEFPRLYDGGLRAESPRLSASALTAESPRLYDSGLRPESSRLYVSGLTVEDSGADYTQLKDEVKNIHYVNSQKNPLPTDKISPLLKDSRYPTALENPYKMKASYQPSIIENSYELNQSHQPITLANSYKLKESYHPTLENSHTVTESYQPTLENSYNLTKECYQTSVSEHKDCLQEDSKANHSYTYDSVKGEISPQEDRIFKMEKTTSFAPKYEHETGRLKNPYTYFYVGRKLWYIPLFFSVYFMFYVLALVVKSISRHKIVFPVTHWKKDKKRDLRTGQTYLEETTHQVTTALEEAERLHL